MFQNYELFPHMTACVHIASGLEVRRMPQGAVDARVNELFEWWMGCVGAVFVDVAGIKILATTMLSGMVSVGIRPEELIFSRKWFESSAINLFLGTITRVEDMDLYQYVHVDIDITLAAVVTRQSMERLYFTTGDQVTVAFKATAVQVFV